MFSIASTLTYSGKVLRLFSVICTILLILSCAEKEPQLHTVTGATMGTWYTVKYLPPQQFNQYSADQISTEIHTRLNRVDSLMSTYKKDSEVSRFNHTAQHEWFSVSQETFEVLVLAQQISKQTHGAFDITVAPLVRLWGFGPDYQQQQIPDAKILANMLQHVGFVNLETDEASHRVRKQSAITIDLSAIAKGYGVDQVAAYLDGIGSGSYMVEVGGEIRAKGLKPGNVPWRIAIESPQIGDQGEINRSVQKIIDVVDLAVATSGDYRNYFEKDGQRYSHTIDPKTGYPITHNLASVTVLSDTAARADALATAFSVMGAEKAIAFSVEYNIAAYFIIKEQDGFVAFASDAFDAIPLGGL